MFFITQEAQLNEVLSASNLDPTALTVVTRKLEVSLVLCKGIDSRSKVDFLSGPL